MIQYSVVIPVYNGESTIELLYSRLESFFDNTEYNFEVIFVYDHGNDDSWAILLKLKSLFPETIKLISLSRNFGQHNAIICGFEHSLGEYIITLDEDLQHAPEDISKLISKLEKGDFDIVYGKYDSLNHSLVRNFGSQLLKRLIKISIPELHPDYSAYRLIKSSIAKATIDMKNSYTFIDGYLSWITTNCGSCIVLHSERQGGESGYTFGKLLNHAINIFVTFSNYPIRLVTKLSIWLIFLMFLFSIYIVARKLMFDDFAVGFPSIILAIGYGVGLIMMSLGVLGEYIYRINLKTTKRPNYNISKIV